VFLPNTIELQRFVLSGAFTDLAVNHALEFVFQPRDAEAMLSAAPNVITTANSHRLDIPPRRFKEWARLFEASCYVNAHLSRSFALRHSAQPDSASLRFARGAWEFVDRNATPVMGRIPLVRRYWGGVSRRAQDFIAATVDQKASALRAEKQAEAEAILHAMTPYEPLVELLDQVNPLFVVQPTSLLDDYCNDLLLAANATGNFVLLLQSGWDNLSSKGLLHHRPHYLGAWGPQAQEHAKTIQRISKSQSRPLGAPHYEALKPLTPEERAAFRAKLGVALDETLILFGGSFRQFDETSVLAKLDAAISAGELGKVKIVYRPHPWRADRSDEDNFFERRWANISFDPDMVERYQRSKAEKGYLKTAPMFDMPYLASLLSSVDAVMSPMSTLLLESLIMKRPTMAVAFGDDKHAYHPGLSSKMTHFDGLSRSKALIWCGDEKDFIAKARALCDAAKRPISEADRADLLSNVVVWDDSHASTYSRRLAAYAEQEIDVPARRAMQKRSARRRKHMSRSYGALDIVRDYAGHHGEALDIPGYWMHGWIPAFHNVHPAFIALHKKEGQGKGYDYLAQIEHEKCDVMQWVSRKDQADYLSAEGYQHVRAIGLPFCYLPPANIQRVPGSLLVMPPHSHRTHGPDDPVAEGLAEAILAKANLFSEVMVCLNADDYSKNEWRSSFEKRGIKVIVGADQGEGNTLLRLKQMLSRFEYVTTNGYGSHIAYAAACGAKVSIFGPYADFPQPVAARCHAVKMFPQLERPQIELCAEPGMRGAFPFLFVDPEKAQDLTAWGLRELGADLILSPEDMARAFGWPPLAAVRAPAPQLEARTAS